MYPLSMSIAWIIGGLVFSLRWERKKEKALPFYPFFSIIVPARNEETIIADTILKLKTLDYPKYEVIAVNDGSTDRTGEIIDRLAEEHYPWLRAVHVEPNSGKSQALNAGILLSQGEFILTIDADCLVHEDTLKLMAWHLVSFPRVGAVTGNPRVWNRTTLLGKIQIGEYSNIIGLIKRTQRILGKVLTVSGVIAAYRKSALLECGLFDSNTVTEDIDITWKLQKKFWDIRYEPQALCWVLVPETLKGLWRQRIRWAQGGVEVIKKHVNIWRHWHYRRLWPVYVDYCTGILWAYSFFFLVCFWLVFLVWDSLCSLYVVQTYCPVVVDIYSRLAAPNNPIYPRWAGAILCLACLMEFFVSFMIDYRYERKGFFRYYFWVIWYPFVYWIISALTAIKGSYNVFFSRKGVTVRWTSPDRGIHTLKS